MMPQPIAMTILILAPMLLAVGMMLIIFLNRD
jgi:hypothetical protein